MDQIPSYALYGEATQRPEWFHAETIPVRSRRHGFTIAPHRHSHLFQVLILTAGRADMVLDGETHQLHAPAVAVLPALSVHGYTFSRDVDGHVLSLLTSALPRDILPAAAVLRDAAVIAAAHDLMHEPADPYAQQARATLLLIAINRATQTPPAPGTHLSAFRALIEQHFRTPRPIKTYASALGISQTHLARLTRAGTGQSPLEMIEQRIALEIKRNLLFTNRSMKQIAADLGYDDPAYFSRVAARLLGQSARAYRANSVIRATAPPPPAPPA